jgi:hypothetical protein
LPVEFLAIFECLHWRTALAISSLVSPLIVVVIHELVKIRLDLLDGEVQLLPKRDCVKLILERLIEPLD